MRRTSATCRNGPSWCRKRPTSGSIVFAEPVEDRKAVNVLPAIARINARLRALGLPVMRLHADRARELVSAP